MAFKMRGWSPFKNVDEKKRYYTKTSHSYKDSSTDEHTFGSGGRPTDDPKKHKQVVLTKFSKNGDDLYAKRKYKRGSNIPTKSKGISKARYNIETAVRRFLLGKNK